MIGKLKGIIDFIGDNHVIVDVNGVGYVVFCSANTLRQLPEKGGSAGLLIETHVREDHIHLYGFATSEERQAFLTLNKVNGVGTKMALAVLSCLTPGQLASAVAAEDKAAFKNVSGVGPKLAVRLVTELKDEFSFTGAAEGLATSGTNVKPLQTNSQQDAISALVNLGYSRTDAYNVVMKVAAGNDNVAVHDLIRLGLKELAKG